MFKYAAIGTLFISSQLLMAQAFAATEEPVAADESPVQQSQLPLKELRNFTEIFDRIRSSYVEPVDDKTLLQYAIDG
ncbi:hypothetical protein A9R00_02940, partial [Oleispira antarctica]